MSSTVLPDALTLPAWIGQRAELHGERDAITYVDDDHGRTTWTYRDLWSQASAVAALLPETREESPRALLLYPPGIDFMAAFLGCQIAGWIPVPTCFPRAGRALPRLDSAAADCAPSALLGDRATIDQLVPDNLGEIARSLPTLATDIATPSNDWICPDSLATDADALALLQYTSGSTSEPKGVMVRHRNLMANLDAIRQGFQIDWQTDDDASHNRFLFWLPFFHDMGLVGSLLEPLYLGGHTVLMSPRAFLQRPVRWLQSISDYGAVISGAPNFAYQLCVDRISPEQTDSLDLSRWRVAFSGAEPVLARTLQDFANRFAQCGFSSAANYPCYGLAEATLLVSGSDGPGSPRALTVQRESLSQGKPQVSESGRGREYLKLISCGSAVDRTEIRIVDPETHRVVDDLVIGEIWIRGAGVTDGYWDREAENRARFAATLRTHENGSPGLDYFRTGDLGFQHRGELFVTGRLKDLIILRGRNHFPLDIESTVQTTIGPDCKQCAAIAVDGGRGEALAVLAEMPRHGDPTTYPDVVRQIRRAIIETHDVDPRHVWFVRTASIPMTTSGKIQRSRCRATFDADEFKTQYRYDRASASEQVPIQIPHLAPARTDAERRTVREDIESWMTQWLIARAGVEPDDIVPDRPFADYGLDSMTAVEMSGEIEDWSGVELTPMVAWNHPSVAQLSEYITREWSQANSDGRYAPDSPVALTGQGPDEGSPASEELAPEENADHAFADKRRSRS